MKLQSLEKGTVGHEMRSFMLVVWLIPMFVLSTTPATWGSVYECKSSAGSIIFTDSPSQLEKCTVISTMPAAEAKKQSYPGSPPAIDMNTAPIQSPPELAPTPAPEPVFAPSDPSNAAIQQTSTPAPVASPAPGMAVNQLHPFLPSVPVAPIGN